MKRKTAVLLGASVAVLAALASGNAKLLAKGAARFWISRERAKERAAEQPFGHVAASQVGYGPSMSKRFTSSRRFSSFRVVRQDGAVLMQGGQPHEKRTDLLGPAGTVWAGDFSALNAPGRYRIEVDSGHTSHPFDVSAEVFDRPLRAVQRGFYFQRA